MVTKVCSPVDGQARQICSPKDSRGKVKHLFSPTAQNSTIIMETIKYETLYFTTVHFQFRGGGPARMYLSREGKFPVNTLGPFLSLPQMYLF